MIIRVLSFIVCFFFVGSLYGLSVLQDELEYSGDAKHTALGFSNLTDGRFSSAIFYNPSALDLGGRHRYSWINAGGYFFKFVDTSHVGLSVAFREKSFLVSLGYQSVGVGGIERTSYHNDLGDDGFRVTPVQGTFSYKYHLLSTALTYSLREDLLYGAVRFRYRVKQLDQVNASALGVDFSFLYRYSSRLKLTALLEHFYQTPLVFSSGAKEYLPVALRLGGAYSFFKDQGVFYLSSVLSGPSEQWGAGISYRLSDTFELRAGYAEHIYSLGCGVFLEQLNLDFSYSVYDSIVQSSFSTPYRLSIHFDL